MQDLIEVIYINKTYNLTMNLKKKYIFNDKSNFSLY